MAASSSTTRTFLVMTGLGAPKWPPDPPSLGRAPAEPWRASGLRPRGSSLLALEVQVDLLQLLEVGAQALGLLAQPGELAVARGQLAAQREGIVRQANEFGAVALGEPLTAMGTDALVRRVEEAQK